MLFDNMLEISILGGHDPVSFTVGGSFNGDQIEKLSPIFNPDGALIAVKVIGTSDKTLTTIAMYGVPCSIKCG